MSAQLPGTTLGSGTIPGIPSTVAPNPTNWQGSRTFVFYPQDKDHAYEYLTQQPPPSASALPSMASYPQPQSEMMFGGFLRTQPAVFLAQVGNADDSETIPEIGALLSSALPSYFGRHWGDDGRTVSGDEGHSIFEDEQSGCNGRRVKAMWTGLMGFSADECPWVGRVPPNIAGRKLSAQAQHAGLAEGGEWICAGYSGEGMVNAWRCGEALAKMMLGICECPEWLPDPYVISTERYENAKYEDILKTCG
jgi:hypothetical protein